MPKNRMSDLRDHLFETLEQLKDPEAPMDLARAKAISEVAQTIIDSAKVEVQFMKVIDGSTSGSEFFGAKVVEPSRQLPAEEPGLRALKHLKASS